MFLTDAGQSAVHHDWLKWLIAFRSIHSLLHVPPEPVGTKGCWMKTKWMCALSNRALSRQGNHLIREDAGAMARSAVLALELRGESGPKTIILFEGFKWWKYTDGRNLTFYIIEFRWGAILWILMGGKKTPKRSLAVLKQEIYWKWILPMQHDYCVNGLEANCRRVWRGKITGVFWQTLLWVWWTFWSHSVSLEEIPISSSQTTHCRVLANKLIKFLKELYLIY